MKSRSYLLSKKQKKHNEENGKKEYYYVLAFLGSGKSKLERVSSPIFFKVIKNDVFIVAFEIPDELYDAEFAETDYRFDIQDFMDKYVAYYNGKLRKKIQIDSNKEVEKINA